MNNPEENAGEKAPKPCGRRAIAARWAGLIIVDGKTPDGKKNGVNNSG
ncbi:hypothetical protein [Burkholderia cepacia]|nr:hypothetical protein [Burkholderia cepacia]